MSTVYYTLRPESSVWNSSDANCKVACWMMVKGATLIQIKIKKLLNQNRNIFIYCTVSINSFSLSFCCFFLSFSLTKLRTFLFIYQSGQWETVSFYLLVGPIGETVSFYLLVWSRWDCLLLYYLLIWPRWWVSSSVREFQFKCNNTTVYMYEYVCR